MLFVLCAVSAALSAVLPPEAVLAQAVDRVIGDKHNTASAATVPTVGAASRHELLAVEADQAVSTITGFDPDVCAINQRGSVSMGTL
jgi:hypothetical protein